MGQEIDVGLGQGSPQKSLLIIKTEIHITYLVFDDIPRSSRPALRVRTSSMADQPANADGEPCT